MIPLGKHQSDMQFGCFIDSDEAMNHTVGLARTHPGLVSTRGGSGELPGGTAGEARRGQEEAMEEKPWRRSQWGVSSELRRRGVGG